MEVTACVPTFRRPDDLRETLRALVAGSAIPDHILVSEGDPQSREASSKIARKFNAELLSPPPNANRSGNRNWLTRHAQTEFNLFVDDDVSVHPDFLRQALPVLAADSKLAVITPGTTSAQGAVWLTPRGHFTLADPDGPICPSFSTSLWRTNILRRYPLEERLRYGYEDADMAFRMARGGDLRAVVLPGLVSVDRGADLTVDMDQRKKQLADSARVFVGIRRYWGRRWMILRFLATEASSNALRGRRPMPRAEVAGQWRDTARHVRSPQAEARIIWKPETSTDPATPTAPSIPLTAD